MATFPSSLIHAPGRTILRGLAKFAVLFVALLAILTVLEVPFAPWARSLGMWPTLTGDWTGELKTNDGQARPVLLAIRGGVQRRGRVYIEGRARLCDRSDAIRDFEIFGKPDNWRGSRFHLSTRSVLEHDSGFGPGELQGEWQGDLIRATGVIVSGSPIATASVTRGSRPAEPPPVQYTLRRGTEKDFLVACGKRTTP